MISYRTATGAVVALWCVYACTAPARATVTEVSVAKGHQLTDVKQKLYKSGKVATSHSLTWECTDAPTEDDKARLTVSALRHAYQGYYKFNIHAASNASEGQYELTFYDQTTKKTTAGKRTLPRKLTVHVMDIVVVYVGFLSGATGDTVKPIKIIVDATTDRTVVAPEWWNAIRNDPIAYVRNTGTKKVQVKLQGPPDYSCTIDATGSWGGILDKNITFNAQGICIDNSFTMASAVPHIVRGYDIGWQWRVTKNQETHNINTTSHKIYIIYANNDSTCSNRYRTLYGFSCDWADGQSSEADVFNAIWSDIASLTATPYYYYKPGEAPPDVFTTRALIVEENGRCGAWKNFFADVVGVQGIQVNRVGVYPLWPRKALRVPLANLGQGNVTPAVRTFYDHGIVRYGNKFYDPSYGTGPYNALLDWEKPSVEAYLYDGTPDYWQDDVYDQLEVRYEIQE